MPAPSTPKYTLEFYDLPAPIVGEKQMGFRVTGFISNATLVTKTDYLVHSLMETCRYIGIELTETPHEDSN